MCSFAVNRADDRLRLASISLSHAPSISSEKQPILNLEKVLSIHCYAAKPSMLQHEIFLYVNFDACFCAYCADLDNNHSVAGVFLSQQPKPNHIVLL